MRSDITAVVLTIGEETTKETIKSLNNQIMSPAEIVVIKDIYPFYKAMNEAASRVKTEFFIQVDADMILYENALATLRKVMDKKTGIAVGVLKDSLIGNIAGLKMFRTSLFEKHEFKNKVSQDTFFASEIKKSGWRVKYVAGGLDKFLINGRPLGEHRPAYGSLYTFCKFRLEGRRIRYRKNFYDFICKWKRLKKSLFENTNLFALTGMSHGMFERGGDEGLRPFVEDVDFRSINEFIKDEKIIVPKKDNYEPLYFRSPGLLFGYYLDKGMKMLEARSLEDFMAILIGLSKKPVFLSGIAAAGLCKGLFCIKDTDKKDLYETFDELIGASWPAFLAKRSREMLDGLKRYFTHFV